MLVQVKGKMDRFQYLEILENAMIPSAWSIRGLNYIFMYDKTCCHKAHLITDWMDKNNVNCTTWPAKSPDLNPIENLWEYLERKLEKLPTTLSQLWDTINDLWENTPMEIIQNLVSSMPQRIKAVLKQSVGTQSTRHLYLHNILF